MVLYRIWGLSFFMGCQVSTPFTVRVVRCELPILRSLPNLSFYYKDHEIRIGGVYRIGDTRTSRGWYEYSTSTEQLPNPINPLGWSDSQCRCSQRQCIILPSRTLVSRIRIRQVGTFEHGLSLAKQVPTATHFELYLGYSLFKTCIYKIKPSHI